jgi:predicted aspartyl protease
MSTSRILSFMRVFAPVLLASLSLATTLPFDPSRGLVEIGITINGKIQGRFGIDTGADRLYLNRTFAIQNGLIPNQIPSRGKANGLTGSSMIQNVGLGSFKIGDEATLMNIPAAVIDLESMTQNVAGGVPDGLIGFDVLKQFYITVDYPAHSIELRTDAPRYLDGRAYHTVPFRAYRHLIVVDATINGNPVSMVLDYCASHTIISPELAGRLGLTGTGAESFVTIKSASLGEDMESGNFLAAVMSLDEYRRAVPDTRIEGLLGGTFLQTHVVTIDYGKHCLYIPYR